MVTLEVLYKLLFVDTALIGRSAQQSLKQLGFNTSRLCSNECWRFHCCTQWLFTKQPCNDRRRNADGSENRLWQHCNQSSVWHNVRKQQTPSKHGLTRARSGGRWRNSYCQQRRGKFTLAVERNFPAADKSCRSAFYGEVNRAQLC